MTALGVDGLSGDKSKLEQRLLKAVRDLQLVQSEKDKLSDELVQLSEAVLRYTKVATTDDAEARMALEARLRSVAEVLGIPGSQAAPDSKTPAMNGTLTNGMVVSIKEELSLVIANIGSRQGVRVGMPFKVVRDDHLIGLVRVVDVREKICGAVIQSLDSEKNKIKVGDRLMVDAR
jgi:cell shape-determining protein MreC